MTRPAKFPRWATVPLVDPVVGGSNVVEPPEQQKDDGWQRKQKPPANYQNWLHNLTYLWLVYLDGIDAEALPKDYRSGVLLANNSTDPAKDIDFQAGKWRSSDDTTNLILSATMTKQMDADWAEGTDAGGFPSALTLTADTYYHCFEIGKPDGTTDAGVDSDINAVNLLADATGYTKFRRVHTILTDATPDVVPFHMYYQGKTRITYWDTPTEQYNVTAPGTAAIPITMRCPSDINVQIIFTYYFDSITLLSLLYFSPLDTADIVPTFGLAQVAADPTITGYGQAVIESNTLKQIRARMSASDGNTKLTIYTIGWKE